MNCQRLYENEDLENKIYDIVLENNDYADALRNNNHYDFHYFLSPSDTTYSYGIHLKRKEAYWR